LAQELKMTVRQLLANVTSEELTEWSLLYQLQAMERKHAEAMSKGGGGGAASRVRR
jgi:hypothetical protein